MKQLLLSKAISLLFFSLTIVRDVNGTVCLTKIPDQIRLALRPTGVTVSWTTCGILNFDDTPKPQVQYGTDPNALTNLSPVGFTTSYHPLPILKRFFHNVYLDGLSSSTKYYYRIKASTLGVSASSVLSFTTAPSSTITVQQAVNISIVGDLGLNNYFNGNQAQNTITAMRQYISSSNLFLHIGDISYADLYGLVIDFKLYEDTWNLFQQAIQPITSVVPYQVLPGNHEATCFQYSDAVCPSYLKNFTAYNNRFYMSGDISGGYKNMWYSYNYGPVHFVMINTETDFPNAPDGPGTTLNAGHFLGTAAQLAWLQNDLQQATAPSQRAKVPWIVVAGHRPFYGSNTNPDVEIAGIPITTPSDNCDTCRTAFFSLLAQYKVDFYFAGHVHWMELLYPLDGNGNVVANNFNNVNGVIHVTNGAGAAPTGAETVKTVDTARRAFFFGGYGFQQLLVRDSSHATLIFIDSSTKNVINSVDIVRNH